MGREYHLNPDSWGNRLQIIDSTLLARNTKHRFDNFTVTR